MFPSGESAGENFNLIPKILEADMVPPSVIAPAVPKELDAIVMRALNREREARYPDARSFAMAIESVTPIASTRRVGEWVETVAAEALAERARQLHALERASHDRSAMAAPVVDAAIKARQRKRLASAPQATTKHPPINDMATAVDDPNAGPPPDSELEISTAVRDLPEPATQPRDDGAMPLGKRTSLAETVEDIPSGVGRAAAEMASEDDFVSTLVSGRQDAAGEDFEGPEPKTLVSQKSLQLKGPPGLPDDEDSWDRASTEEIDSRNAPTGKSPRPISMRPIPSDVPPMGGDEFALPVSSSAWIWIVLALLAIGGGAAAAFL